MIKTHTKEVDIIMNINFNKKKYLLIPLILAAILSLSVLFSSKWPLSWDIYTHINYAITYINYGITTVDPYLNAPNGKEIGYVPLFHILLIVISSITNTSLIDTARIIQTITPVIITSIIVYVTYKMYDEVAAIVAGILLVSSFMFTRLLLPSPETIALIVFIIGVYLFYQSTIDNKMIYAFISGFLTLPLMGIHFSSCVYYVILISVLMIAQCIIQGKLVGLKSYGVFLLALIIVGLCGVFALITYSPSHLSQFITGFNSVLNDPLSLFMGQKAMGLERYIKCVGLLPLVCGFIGLCLSFRNREVLFVSAWTLIAFIFSNMHWFGIPVYTFRMLIYLLIPLVILGGYGVSKIYGYLINTNKKQQGVILILLLIILSYGCGYMSIHDDSAKITSASTQIGDYQIAPPTSDEEEVINWFKNEDTQNKSILTNNQFFGTVVSSIDEIPLHYKFDVYTNKSSQKSSLKTFNNEKIGYIIYDKTLVVNNSSDYSNLEVISVNGSYYPSYYFTKEITENNFDQIKLTNTEKVFENNRFIICKIKS